MTGWQYGIIREARAFRIGDRLIVRVEGTQPTPCCEVRLAPYEPEGSVPVRLGLYWKPRPEPCAVEGQPFTARTEVSVDGRDVNVVRVEHADGFTDVPVLRSMPP